MRKRSRACAECHRLKIRCEPSAAPSSTSTACERCERGHLVCVPTAPRLQRDRIQELLAQVDQLSSALREQSNGGHSGGHSSTTTPDTAAATPSATTATSRSPGSHVENGSYHHGILALVDARIPLETQQWLVDTSARQMASCWPVVVPATTEIDHLRAKSPVLLLALVAFTATHDAQGTELEAHDELVREAVHILGDQVIGRGQRSLEMIQAMLVAAFWSKYTRRGLQGSGYQLSQLAAEMAMDIGIAGPALLPSPAAYFATTAEPRSAEARRTWLACYVALAQASASTRRPNAVPWDGYHDECVLWLEARAEPGDVLLGQIVRVTRVIGDISDEMSLCRVANFVDGNDLGTYDRVQSLKRRVDDWTSQVPASLASCQMLKAWRHFAMIQLYEVSLHTPTNKASFAPPFIPGRIPVRDLPAPTVVIPPLRAALAAMVGHCHALIETTADMDAALVIALPGFCFAPAVLYALFVLITAAVASSGPASTYGRVLGRDAFRIEPCARRMRSLVARLKALDPTLSTWTCRMLDASSWLEEWHGDYKGILGRYEAQATST